MGDITGAGRAAGPSLTGGAVAHELVDLVQAAAVLQAGAAGALIRVHLAVQALVAWQEQAGQQRPIPSTPAPQG